MHFIIKYDIIIITTNTFNCHQLHDVKLLNVMIKTYFLMNHIDVRNICTKYELCTKCDCVQYDEILNMCDIDTKSFDTLKKQLYEIANLIYCYSDVDEINVETILFYLMNECVNTLFEIK